MINTSVRKFNQEYTIPSLYFLPFLAEIVFKSKLFYKIPKLREIWICRHFCVKLLTKKEQFDSWEFKVNKNGALCNNVEWIINHEKINIQRLETLFYI